MYNRLNSQIDLHFFKTINPVWVHPTFDSTSPMNTWTDLFYIKSIKQDSAIYSIYSNFINQSYIDGGYIEKINLNTGKTMWNHIWDLRHKDTVESPSNMYMLDDGRLEILNFKGSKKYDKNAPEGTYYMANRIYDTKSGNLLSMFYPDSSLGIVTKFYLETLLIKHGNQQYKNIFYPIKGTIFNFFISTSLSNKFNTLRIDSISINEAKYQEVTDFKLVKGDTFVTVISSCNCYDEYSDTFKCQRFLNQYDIDLNLIKSIDITDKFEKDSYYQNEIRYLDDKYIFLWSPYFDGEQWQYTYKIFDYDGNLLEEINLNQYKIIIGAINKISEGVYLICGIDAYQDDAQNPLYFYKKKIGGEMELLKKVEMKKNDYCLEIREIYILPDNDILIGGYYFKISYQIGDILKFPVKIRLSSTDVDITSSNNELSHNTKIAISPNPACSHINIRCTHDGTGKIEVADMLGRIVLIKNTTECEDKEIDISDLKAGMYIVRMLDDRGKVKGIGKVMKL